MKLLQGRVGAASPGEHATSAVHGRALPCLSRGQACTRADTHLPTHTPADPDLYPKEQGLIYKQAYLKYSYAGDKSVTDGKIYSLKGSWSLSPK